MINIAICDDDFEFREFAKEVISNIVAKYQQEVWIDTYQNGEDLLKALEGNFNVRINILVLDIDMPEMDGYAIARILNERYPEVLIIFASNREDLVFQAFEYRPFRFVRKAYFEIEIMLAFRKAFEVIEGQREKSSVIKYIGGEEKLAHRDIIYLMVLRRKVCFYLMDGRVLEVRDSMKTVLDKLSDVKLIQINSGCVVNSAYVERCSSDSIVLKTGEKLPISRGRARNVKIQIRKNWG